jgi:hypothetical protein
MKSMKSLIIALLISSVSYSQASLTGKWKPVFFSFDTFARGDIKADTLFISDALKEIFKNDKDPKASEEMIKMVIEMMFKKMKETQNEYFGDGKYTETSTGSGRTKNGTYTYNEKDGTLQRTQEPLNRREDFVVSWKNGQLVLSSELESTNGKKGKMEVVYERL